MARPLRTALALGLAPTALSLARFGYTVLLPAMRDDLDWSYAQAGAMNTANGLGYLGGSIVAAAAVELLGEHRAFAISFALTSAAVLASGLSGDYAALLALRALAGAAGAVLFVAGGTLAARIAGGSPGLVLGLYFAGVGPGILVSALLAPAVLGPGRAWRLGWMVMGAVAAACAVVASLASRAVPTAPAGTGSGRPRLRRIGWAIAAYTLYGLGYIPYMTFIVAFYRDAGRGGAEIAAFWSLLALAGVASAWAWRRLLDRADGGAALTLLLGVTAAGAALPLLSDGVVGMAASALLFGGAFLGVVAALAQLVRRALPPRQWALGLGAATSLFAAGQAVAPGLTGLVADRIGLRTGLGMAACLLALAAALASRQPAVAAAERDPYLPS